VSGAVGSRSAFEVIPAIDLLEGRCVRLAQGDYERATVYSDDPAEVARAFAAAGCKRLHVVDLDGAREGTPRNGAAIEAVVKATTPLPVQLGGGLRTLEAVTRVLDAGVERAILGTAALRDPELVREAAARHPGQIAVGLDARSGRVAVSGWLETSDARVADVARLFEDAGVAALIYTDIARDGMLTGPDIEGSAALADTLSIPVIASGGVGSLDDVRRAAACRERGIAGVIVGRALYTGDVSLDRALEIAACS
jgi:phosphoribosylformimino-5-aminoimidazole carboxamide ribotide isomerase